VTQSWADKSLSYPGELPWGADRGRQCESPDPRQGCRHLRDPV